ncbi:MAG TPA: hypothetical protein VGX37_12975, partial [Allosphingosinicella sp.]|nr:hypothetical protein [Allosphingosinicella sp.]
LPPPVSTPGTNVPVSGSWSLWQGSLDAGDADTDGHHYDDYLIHVEAGQARYIAVNAQAFDTTVSVITPDQRDSDSPEVLEMDDDTGVGVNSLVAFAPEASGDYIVRVSSYEEDATGPYWLYISQ